jgi:Bacterial regulatory proteins, tetR family
VYRERGYDETTTAQIAVRAGVTERVDSATVLVISAWKRCDELMQRCASCWISNTVNR